MSETVDPIIGYNEKGQPVYDNAPSVVCIMITRLNDEEEVLVVRRARNPGQGLLALPGGFQMRNEKWRNAGIREVYEEIGLRAVQVFFRSVDTDEYGHNVFIGQCSIESTDYNLNGVKLNPDEVTEYLWINLQNWDNYQDQWAFPMHKEAVWDWIRY